MYFRIIEVITLFLGAFHPFQIALFHETVLGALPVKVFLESVSPSDLPFWLKLQDKGGNCKIDWPKVWAFPFYCTLHDA